MTGIHRLKHIESLSSAYLTDDDALGSHTKRRLDKIADGDLSRTGGVCVTRLKADKIIDSRDLELGGVLDGDNALIARNIVR